MSLIKNKRLEIGLMQYAVAKKLGMSTRNYQRIENEGKEPTEKQFEELAKIFNCNVANLRQRGIESGRIQKNVNRNNEDS